MPSQPITNFYIPSEVVSSLFTSDVFPGGRVSSDEHLLFNLLNNAYCSAKVFTLLAAATVRNGVTIQKISIAITMRLLLAAKRIAGELSTPDWFDPLLPQGMMEHNE